MTGIRGTTNIRCAAIVVLCLFFITSYSCDKPTKKEPVEHAKKVEKIEKTNKIWVDGFQTASPLKIKRSGAAGIIVNGYFYVFGGVDGKDFLQTTERAKIEADGTLGEWIEQESLNERRGFFSAVEHKGFIYVVGGGNGPNGKNLLSTVERTRINPDGTLEPWVLEAEVMVSVRRCSKVVLIDGDIYAVGGYNGGFLEYVDRTTINPDGTLGVWTLEDNPTTIGRYINGLAKKDSHLYVIGGHHETEGTGLDSVEWTSLDSDGNLNKWKKSDHFLLQRRYGQGSIVYDNFLYAIGGVDKMSYQNSVEISSIGTNNEPGEWMYSTPLGMPRESVVSVLHKENLYVAGGSNMTGFLNSVEWATIRKDGRIGYWVDKKDVDELVRKRKVVRFNGSLIHPSSVNDYFNEGNSYFMKEMYEMAEESFQKTLAIDPNFIDGSQNLSATYLRLKKYDSAMTIIDRLLAKQENSSIAHYNKACVYALQGKADLAISSLLVAVEHGYNDLGSIETDSDLDSIRRTPGYRKVIRAVIMKE